MGEHFDYHLDQEGISKIFHDNKKLDDTDRSIFAIILAKRRESTGIIKKQDDLPF